MGEIRSVYNTWIENPEGKRPHRRTQELMEGCWGNMVGDSSGSGQGPVVGCCEHGNELSGSIKGGKFLG
jgi:hypothetical protein